MMPELIGLPADSLVTYVSEKSFTTGKSKLVNEGLMSSAVSAVMQDRWVREFPDRTIQFHSLRNVYVVGEGLVFDQAGRLYAISVTQNGPTEIAAACEALQRARHTKQVRYYPGCTLLCGKMGLSNYGHWLLEMAPMAYLAREWIGQGWDVFVPKAHGWIRDKLIASFDLLWLERERISYADGEPWFFEEIILVTGLSSVGLFYSPSAIDCMRYMATRVSPVGCAKVWVARTDNAGVHRSLVGEHALCDLLAGQGWLVIHPGAMSMPEQIAACKGARHIAGVAGAGLTNAGYMAPGGKVTCFMPATMPDIFFLHIAHHAGLDYREVRSLVDDAGRLTLSNEEVLAELDAHSL